MESAPSQRSASTLIDGPCRMSISIYIKRCNARRGAAQYKPISCQDVLSQAAVESGSKSALEKQFFIDSSTSSSTIFMFSEILLWLFGASLVNGDLVVLRSTSGGYVYARHLPHREYIKSFIRLPWRAISPRRTGPNSLSSVERAP